MKGGAYGAGFQMTRPGSMRFYSYRDPHIDETVARFEGAGSWIAAFDPTPAEMDGYVVSTIAGIDVPLKARELMRRQDGQFFSHFTPEQRARVRSEVIATTPISTGSNPSFILLKKIISGPSQWRKPLMYAVTAPATSCAGSAR